MSEQPSDRPTLQLVRGDAAPEEIAALLSVLSARIGAPAATASAPRPVGRWGDVGNGFGRQLRPGPGAWRASGRPHAAR